MLLQDRKTSNKTERNFQHKSSVKSAREISPFIGTPMHLEAYLDKIGSSKAGDHPIPIVDMRLCQAAKGVRYAKYSGEDYSPRYCS
jgi:hypothetical protein